MDTGRVLEIDSLGAIRRPASGPRRHLTQVTCTLPGLLSPLVRHPGQGLRAAMLSTSLILDKSALFATPLGLLTLYSAVTRRMDWLTCASNSAKDGVHSGWHGSGDPVRDEHCAYWRHNH